MRVSTIGLAWLLALGGCVTTTATDTELQRLNAEWATVTTIRNECSEKYVADLRVRGLAERFVTEVEAPLAKMTSTDKPTVREAEQVLAYHRDTLTPCRARLVEAVSRIHPSYVVVVTSNYTRNDALLAQLVRRTLSWGDYNLQASQSRQELQKEMTKVDGEIRQHLTDSARYEQQRRDAAMDALQQWNIQQQMISAANRQRMTSCSYTGQFINCTTY